MKLFTRLSLIIATIVLLISPPVLARGRHQDRHQNHDHSTITQPPIPTPEPIPGPQGNATVSLVTYYGYPDNSPPGTVIEFPQIHKGAGGTGTYADPLTFATSPKEYAPGTKLYIPYISKYVIMEDSCAECISDWNQGKSHIDIWMPSNANFKSQVIACEEKYTKNNIAIIVNPPSNLAVTAPLFDVLIGKCL